MGLRIFNTLTGQKEEFKPLHPPDVHMYVCGPTVYDEPHIGHLRSVFAFEVMRNWLEYSGYKVRFVRNVTDVDDKIIEKARQENAPDLKAATTAVSSRYFDLYKKDLAALGIREPSSEPRATQNIDQMKELIGRLIQKGFAYHVPGSSDVYFEVKRFSSYGKLSKQKIDEMMDQARKESAPGKRDALDFALWKGAKPDEPAWESSWGPGRPGWHIECSAMNLACLGEQIDIHGGGLDLKFPHHENEIAQTEAATGRPFSKYWIHHGLVTVSGQKMSKSLKNFVSLSVVNQASPDWGVEELKFLFLCTHYAAALDYSPEKIAEAKAVRERFVYFFKELAQAGAVKPAPAEIVDEYRQQFCEAMEDDFNTPKALAVLHGLVGWARKTDKPEMKMAAAREIKQLAALFGVTFGIDLNVNHDLISILEHVALSIQPAEVSEIEALIRQRNEARKAKDFKKADEIRNKLLLDKKIAIMDEPSGETSWRRV